MKLVIVPPALAELHDAAAYYTVTANADLGRAFLSEFERAANSIPANPHVGVLVRGTRRRYLLRRFPYSIFYQISGEELWIIAVAHHARRPAYWSGRR